MEADDQTQVALAITDSRLHLCINHRDGGQWQKFVRACVYEVTCAFARRTSVLYITCNEITQALLSQRCRDGQEGAALSFLTFKSIPVREGLFKCKAHVGYEEDKGISSSQGLRPSAEGLIKFWKNARVLYVA